MASGPGAPWWQRGSAIGAPNNSFSFVGEQRGNIMDSDNMNGNWLLDADGMISILIPPGMVSEEFAYLDIGKTVAVGADNWTSGAAGTTEIKLIVKKGAKYSSSDWTGKWVFHSIAGGEGAPWWMRQIIDVNATGAATVNISLSDGSNSNLDFTDFNSEIITLSPDGMVSHVLNSSAEGVMDEGKTIVTMTSDWQSGTSNTTDISVGMKMGDSYSQAEFAGKWAGYAINFGNTNIYKKIITTIELDGKAMVEEYDNNNLLLNTIITSATIDANGISVAAPGNEDSMCSLDVHKTIFICTRTESWNADGSVGVTVLTVLVKTKEF